MTEAQLHENPLVPHKKLRQMYVAMIEARVLDEHITEWNAKKKTKAKRKLASTRGEEACRVSTAIDLGSGDLVSDDRPGMVMDLIAGAPVRSLLRRLKKDVAGASRIADAGARQLPWISDAGERLRLAMGAALAIKTLNRAQVVVAYVRCGEVGKSEWRTILDMAAKLELPMLFVVLPDGAGQGKRRGTTAKLSAKARSYGVPGMLAEASDAVALYRVAQEAMGRIRGGGGPVLVECAAYRLEGAGELSQADPISQMRQFLLERRVATKLWLDRAEDRVRLGSGEAPGSTGLNPR